MAPKLAMDELMKKRTVPHSKLIRALEDAKVLANAPLDYHAVKIEMGLLEILGANFQVLEDEILMTCPQQEFDAQQAEPTTVLQLYKSIKVDETNKLRWHTCATPCSSRPVSTP